MLASNIALVFVTVVLAAATIALAYATSRYTKATEKLYMISKMNVADNILRVIIKRQEYDTPEGKIYAKYIEHLKKACNRKGLIPKDIPDDEKATGNTWVIDQVTKIHADLFTDLLMNASANIPEGHNRISKDN